MQYDKNKRFQECARGFALMAAAVLSAAALATEPQQGDLTSAIREGAGLTATVDGPRGSDKPVSSLFDGVLSRSGVPQPWEAQRWYVSSKPAGGVVFTYDVPAAFVPGEQVVVTGITFAVGWVNQDGSGSGWWGNEGYHKRMPSAWTIEGSNDGGTSWETICDVSGFGGYANTRWYAEEQDETDTSIGNDTYEGTHGFYNWLSFRKYRITITENRGGSMFCQLSEIKLHGIWGGAIPSAPPLVDLTAAARAVNGGTPSANVPDYNVTRALTNAFNGNWNDGDTVRYLSQNAATLVALTNGGVWVCYTFDSSFRPGDDVVATGYKLGVWTRYNAAIERMPRTWKLQGSNDGASWTTLDEHENFNLWQYTSRGDGTDDISFTFHFSNNASYRRYRILVTKLYGEGPLVSGNLMSDANKSIQFSEMAIFGYVGAQVAGTLSQTEESYPLDIMKFGRDKNHGGFNYYTPIYSDTAHVVESGYPLSNLFDNDVQTRILYTLDDDLNDGEDYFPYVISYAMPDHFLAGKDIVVTNYTIETKKWNWALQRLPKSWRLEGYVCDRWVTLDRRDDFTAWTLEQNVYSGSPTDRYFGTFAISGNLYSARQYRLRILSVCGDAIIEDNHVHQIQMGELNLYGKWGDKLGKIPPNTMIIIR